MNFGSFDEILAFAIDKEKEAVAFYTDLSKKENIQALKKTFFELAQEEARHVKMLTGMKGNKGIVESYPIKEITDLKISDYLVDTEYVEGMILPDILVLAMKREEMAVKLYRSMAQQSKNAEAKDLFNLLVREESQHKRTFEVMYDDYAKTQGN
jgi:rubrerythrin